MKICLIDNYDSFTFNVEHQLLMLDHEVNVIRNDKISIDEISQLDYDAFVIGPGPSNPKNAGISLELINYFYDKKPILGICLGHQCIGEVFGGKIVIADKIMHGKTSNLSHTKSSIFQNIKEPYIAMRYHSLVISEKSVSDDLEILAWCEDDNKKTIMAVKHKTYPVVGIQFHPESIFTEQGNKLLDNFFTVYG
jgi:anthranilate synthase/aminodeoxychorismate synthase-like glutamine amidotransferase